MEPGLTVALVVLILLFLVLFCGIIFLLVMQVRQSRQQAKLEPVTQAVSGIQQSLAEQQARLDPVTQAVSTIQQTVSELQGCIKARQDLERQSAESIRRLEMVIAGTQSKGSAGENILEQAFSRLPPDWQLRNVRVGDKTVEFGLRLPNSLILPIDSKWPATHLLEQFVAAEDPEEQQALKTQIESRVLSKAKELRKYIDPDLTVRFGIAVVPDAVYDLCREVQVDAFRMNVVVISYSMFVPYLLLVFQTVLKTAQSVDMERLDAYLDSVQASIDSLQGELQGRFSRAMTMLSNSREDMTAHLSKVSSGLAGLRMSDARQIAQAYAKEQAPILEELE